MARFFVVRVRECGAGLTQAHAYEVEDGVVDFAAVDNPAQQTAPSLDEVKTACDVLSRKMQGLN